MDESVRGVLLGSQTVAVVGLSNDPERYSYKVAKYLQEQGYRIIPVNPNVKEILGEKSYSDLLFVPERVDVVQIFRKPEFVPEIVDQAIQIGAKTIWMQEGIVHEAAARKARKAGLQVVMNQCMMKNHYKLHHPHTKVY